MIINHALSYTFEVSYLREQGYLKQYHPIVKSPSVFLLSEAVVGFIHLVWSSLVLVLLMSLSTGVSFVYLALSLLVMLLIYSPCVMFCSFFPNL